MHCTGDSAVPLCAPSVRREPMQFTRWHEAKSSQLPKQKAPRKVNHSIVTFMTPTPLKCGILKPRHWYRNEKQQVRVTKEKGAVASTLRFAQHPPSSMTNGYFCWFRTCSPRAKYMNDRADQRRAVPTSYLSQCCCHTWRRMVDQC
jgi:hypothetical protein